MRSPRMRRRPEPEQSRRRFDPTLWGLWLLITLPPLVVLPGLVENFRLPKLAASELLAMVTLALLALRLWHREGLDWRQLLRHPAVVAIAPLLLVASLGWWTTEHPERVHQALPSLWIGAACLVAFAILLRSRERQQLLSWLVAPAVLLAVIGILQFHALIEFAFAGRVTARIGLTSLAGGAFDLAAYLVLPILIAQLMARRATGYWRWLLWLAVAIMVYALLVTQTLAAIFALGVGSVLLWAPIVGRRRTLALIGGLLVVGSLAVLLISPLRQRVEKKVFGGGKGGVNSMLTGRLDGWRAGAWMVGQRPLLGVGHGAYRSEFGHARLALSDQGVKFFRGQKQVFFVNAHNDVLEAAAEWGLPGLLALLWALACCARSAWHRWRQQQALAGQKAGRGESSSSEADEGGLAIAAFVALLLLALTSFPMHLALIAYPWLVFLSGLLGDPVLGEA